MTVTTYVHKAFDNVEEEQDQIDGKLAAFDRFVAGVRELEPVVLTESSGATALGGGGAGPAVSIVQCTPARAEKTDRVRKLFAETVWSYTITDLDKPKSLVETMEAELSREIAAILVPTTSARFTAEVKEAIRSPVQQRRAELRAKDRACKTEAESLTTALENLELIINWLVTANETSLLNLGFEMLRERYETLAAHRTRCDAIVRKRQKILHGTTNHNAMVGLTHQSFVKYLYQNLPTSYPVLSTAVRLDKICIECQRTVRDHLTRRV